MEYNTGRKKLACPEYGRNIQLLIDYAQTIENPIEQDRFVREIITIMGNMNPHLRDVPDFKHKLWDHLAIMSDFKLPKNSPYPMPERDNLSTKPIKVEYSGGEMMYPEYGRIIEKLIKKAITIDDPDRQNELKKTISNHIKKANLLWGKDISDEAIFKILKDISQGQLEVQEGIGKLIDGQDFINKNKSRNNNRNNNNRNNNGKNNNQNNRGNKNQRPNNRNNKQY
ncbi:MAG: DUF4290 domain-containing protein [Bacteroidales bacterium]|nr:DUF4290 domain-containing protein [Bacteroidales bacterium]